MEEALRTHIEQHCLNFIIAMHQWEINCNDLEQKDLSEKKELQLMQKEVKAIFKQFCTEKERKYGRPNEISYGVKGSYDYAPKEEKIEVINEITSSKIEVHTFRQIPTESAFIYVFIKKKGNWLIDSKKRFSSWKKKWVIDSL